MQKDRTKSHRTAAAEQGLAADGALRPQDRGFFESKIQSERIPDLDGAAAEAQAVGPCRCRTSFLFTDLMNVLHSLPRMIFPHIRQHPSVKALSYELKEPAKVRTSQYLSHWKYAPRIGSLDCHHSGFVATLAAMVARARCALPDCTDRACVFGT